MRSSLIRFVRQVMKMGPVFKSRLNPVTGEAEWVAEDPAYDFHQETARAGYADMLYDHERNFMYHDALRKVIAGLKAKNEHVHVMDIGTGTGLLSMMAAKAGADKVTAVELFEPMAQVAKRIIKHNGFADKIHLISQRSTDMTGDELDNPANVLVAEVFDTELIGEGALRTFNEAHERLLKPNSRVIPARATIWAQPIESNLVLDWKRLSHIKIDQFNVDIKAPLNVAECVGAASVHDLQLDQLPKEYFKPICDPIDVFHFDFENESALKYDEEIIKDIQVACWSKAKRVEAVLMWWHLDMDGTGEFILSTEPNWTKITPSQTVGWLAKMPKEEDKDKVPQLTKGEIVKTSRGTQYKIITKLGEGGFGAVYKTHLLLDENKLFAMKIESSHDRSQVLKMEVKVLKLLERSGGRHFCKISDRGRNDRFNFIIMTLVGKNLSDLRREFEGNKFSLGTSLRVGIQCLEAIEDLHNIGYLHRDLKPGNFAIGMERIHEHRKVYILDYGMCRKFLNDKGELRTPRSTANFRGTVRYAPLNCHRTKELSRKDDLESWFYMQVEVTKGQLPWRQSTDKTQVGKMKETARTEEGRKEMLSGCPFTEYSRLLDYIDELEYVQKPDYQFMYSLMKRIMTANNIKDTDEYDWEADDDVDDEKAASGR